MITENSTLKGGTNRKKAEAIAILNRYYKMHERSLYRALQALKAEQSNRAIRERSLAAQTGLPPFSLWPAQLDLD